MEARGRIRGGVGSVAGGGEGTVRPCLGVWVCRVWVVGGERSVWGVRLQTAGFPMSRSRGRHVGRGGSRCAGGEEGMWAVGVVGTLLWVVNVVKAQNQTEQEGAPPNADPRGSADICSILSCSLLACGGVRSASFASIVRRLLYDTAQRPRCATIMGNHMSEGDECEWHLDFRTQTDHQCPEAWVCHVHFATARRAG